MREVLLSEAGFEMPLIRSTLIPDEFRHGFTTRLGGVSVPPFDSLNVGGKWGDRPDHVAENQRRLRIAAGVDRIFFGTQVHGRDSTLVPAGAILEEIAVARGDAVIAVAPGTAVGVYVADCVPVLIADVRSGACAAVHAGWRGTVAGVLSATLQRMVAELGTRISDVRVAIGPSIGPCCFEVGPEVVSAVDTAFPAARAAGAVVEPVAGERLHVDLWTLNRLAAESTGVATDAIDVAGACTSCNPSRFFSYRRDRGMTGQLAAFIVRAREPPSFAA